MNTEQKFLTKPIRILQIIDCLYFAGGISKAILDWHRNIDKTKIQFDYLYFKETYPNYEQDIKLLGGNCYKIQYPSLKKPWIFLKSINNFFKTHKYDIIHSHMEPFSFMFFLIAKFYGVTNRIQHTHNAKLDENKIKALRNKILFSLAKPLITEKVSCSDLAGKLILKNNYKVIGYGINTENFERKDCSDFIRNSKFDIKDTSKQIENFYFNLNKNNF